MLDYNMRTFGKVSIGVHGKELPKFAEETDSSVKEWWKLKNGYSENPQRQSAKELAHSKKFWSKKDLMLMADVTKEPGPIDPFKTIYSKVEKKVSVIDKVTSINH